MHQKSAYLYIMVKRILITRTKKEWNLILLKIAEKNKRSGLPSYIRHSTSSLIKDFEDCPDCLDNSDGNKIKRAFIVPVDDYKKLEKIAKKLHKPISTVIDDLVISPLLLPK